MHGDRQEGLSHFCTDFKGGLATVNSLHHGPTDWHYTRLRKREGGGGPSIALRLRRVGQDTRVEEIVQMARKQCVPVRFEDPRDDRPAGLIERSPGVGGAGGSARGATLEDIRLHEQAHKDSWG